MDDKMTRLKWDESYSTGIPKIDEQHKKLFCIMSNLNDAMDKGEANNVLKQIIKELNDYTKYHFLTEEDCFEKYGYEEKEGHVKEHLMYLGNIMGFEKDFNDGKRGLSLEILDFLKDWWINHINVVDKRYIELFKENGMS